MPEERKALIEAVEARSAHVFSHIESASLYTVVFSALAQWTLQIWDCMGKGSPAICQTHGYYKPVVYNALDEDSTNTAGRVYGLLARPDLALALEVTWATWGCAESKAVAQSYHSLMDLIRVGRMGEEWDTAVQQAPPEDLRYGRAVPFDELRRGDNRFLEQIQGLQDSVRPMRQRSL